MLADKLNLVKKNIEEACDTAGRSPQEVTLIAVSKTKPVEMLKEAYDAGARVFGENKVQEILDKYDQMPSDVQWHMIGHLQRNKVKYIIDKVSMVHSVDSVRLAEAIEKEAAKKDICMPVLIEVNVAGEESKFGLSVEEVLPFLEEIAQAAQLENETKEDIGARRLHTLFEKMLEDISFNAGGDMPDVDVTINGDYVAEHLGTDAKKMDMRQYIL